MKVLKPTDGEICKIHEAAYKKWREYQENPVATGWQPAYEDLLIEEAYQMGRMSVTVKDI